MQVHGLILVAAGLLIQAGPDDDAAAARRVIDDAIRAHGGEAALAKWPTVTVKARGIFHGHERTPVFFFTSERTTHGAHQSRHVFQGELNGKKFRIAHVLDGNRGWVRQTAGPADETRDYSPSEYDVQRETVYRSWINTLLPLRGREFTLALAGEEMVEDRPALGVRVSSPGRRDVTLFFDKETHLLVKTVTRSKETTGVEAKVETFLRQYKTVEDVKRPMMLTVYHDGRSLHSWWVDEYQVAERPAEGTFIRP